ncbi:MAG: stage II sporulation protein R [Bacillota bacterium]|nr:stage II sporulation protein R [Bacillota bacterium]MDW7684363.1 stage II sporulation protein R [Bacillota bacterium]
MRVYKRIILLFMLFLPFLSPNPAADMGPAALLRLHVRANSDSPADQALKYQVRNAVLDVLNHHLEAAGSAARAEEDIQSALPEVLLAAQNTVTGAGYDYPVSASLGEADFPTRVYGDKVYRAGTYRALQIYLGEGRGQNWWCVLFPPLCFVEVAQDTAIPATTAQQEPPRPKSRLLEWWQRIFHRSR